MEEVKPSEPEVKETVAEEKPEEISEPAPEPVSDESEKPSETPASDTEDELEFLDFSDLKKAIKSSKHR